MENWITSKGVPSARRDVSPPPYKYIRVSIRAAANDMIILQNVTLCFRLNCCHHDYASGCARASLLGNTRTQILFYGVELEKGRGGKGGGVTEAGRERTESGCWAMGAYNTLCL